ncbi:MAG: enolase C-terminal domain-like protein [Thermoplasmatales archaeon]
METSNISSVNVIAVDLPLIGKYRNSLGVKDKVSSVVLILKTDGGICGFSSIEPDMPSYSEETTYNIRDIIRKEFVPILTGDDPFYTRSIMDKLNRSVYGHYMSKALVETAILDLRSKMLGQSVQKMIGGKVHDKLSVIGWIGLGKVDVIKDKLESMLSEGFRCIKIKIGPEIELDLDMLKAIRKEYGHDFAIRVDANQCMTRKTALRFIERAENLELEHIEQPVNRLDFSSMSFLNNRSSIPIMADESVVTRQDLLRLIQEEAASIVKLKVMRSGGIFETLNMISLAEAGGIDCIIGNGFSSSVGTQIEATVASISRSLTDAHEFVGPLKLKEDIVRQKSEYKKGTLIFRTGPGFGYEFEDLNEDLKKKII